MCAEAGVSIEAKSRDKRELRHQMPFGLPIERAGSSLVSCGGCSESLAAETLVVELDTCIDEDGCLLFGAEVVLQAHGIARKVEDRCSLLAYGEEIIAVVELVIVVEAQVVQLAKCLISLPAQRMTEVLITSKSVAILVTIAVANIARQLAS